MSIYAGVTVRYNAYLYYGLGSGSVWLRNVQCKGTEQRLLDCSREYSLGATGCNHYYDVGVTCPS